jgi:anti-sigma B factor antagonist
MTIDLYGFTCERSPEHTLIAIRGELDIASTPSLRIALYAALRDPGPVVVIDLAEVTFCDASGLALLVGAYRRTRARGTAVVLAAPRPQVRRMLKATRLDRAFTVRTSVAEALSVTGAGPRITAA